MAELKLEGKYQEIADLQEAEEDALLAKENVVGVSVGHKISSNSF